MTSPPRGRRAQLPTAESSRPDPLQSDLVLEHVNEQGDERKTYDFARLEAAPALQRELAATFAGQLSPPGPWRAVPTSREMFRLLKAFTAFLQATDPIPESVAQISSRHWNEWSISRPNTSMGLRQRGKVGAFLRLVPGLPADTYRVTQKRTPRLTPTESGYSPEEFTRIRAKAAQVFGAAHRRIMKNAAFLADTTEYEPGSDRFLRVEALEYLRVHGDVPTYLDAAGKRLVRHRYGRVLGGIHSRFTWERLHLTQVEAVALAVLLVAEHGWNSSTVSRLRMPEQSMGASMDEVLYRVELEKRRRHLPHRYETRNLKGGRPGDPGNLITKAIAATHFSRELLPQDHPLREQILLHHVVKHLAVLEPADMIRAGFTDQGVRAFGLATEVRVNLRRLRRTVTVQRKGEPSQNTRSTFDRDYALRDPAFQSASHTVIRSGVEAAIADAARVVARVTKGAPSDPARDTTTAQCTDHTHSPFAEHGTACRASFLLCLACSNALITSAHLPKLAYLHKALDELRVALPEPVWGTDWRPHHARLSSLKGEHFTASEWADALAAVTPADTRLIDQLLRGELG